MIRVFAIDQHIIVTESAQIHQMTQADGSTTNYVRSHRYYYLKDLIMGPKNRRIRALILGVVIQCGNAETELLRC